jgi:hypothetical protein
MATLILAGNIFQLWIFFHLNPNTHPILTGVGIASQLIICLGPFWALYDWFVRRSKRVWKPWLWILFVPWGFLWYYFEKRCSSDAGT